MGRPCNYTDAISLLVDGKRVTGIRARDGQTGRDFEIVARMTVNATGASLDRLLAPIGAATGMPLLMAMNLVTRRDAGEEALSAVVCHTVSRPVAAAAPGTGVDQAELAARSRGTTLTRSSTS
jgi:glycerol-3-phosphate dehydrogenase